MARFANSLGVKAKVVKAPNTRNKAGSPAFEQTDKMKLASILLTSFVQDQFYSGANQTVAELKALMDKVDPLFAAKAAIYARNEFGMRSISHVVAGEIPARVKGETWTKDFLAKVIRRPDDATEILAYYMGTYGKPIPNSLKKGLAKSLGKFDAYQLAKYRGDKNAVSMVDLVNLVHVKPSPKNAEALAKLIDGDLKSEATWEARISAAGKSENAAVAKSEAWAELIASGEIGQFALLRNLRNIHGAVDAAHWKRALELLTDEKRIRKSLILPFRYVTAMQEIDINDVSLTRALNRCVDISCANVPKLDGKTVLAIDHSGSMGGGWGRVADSKSPKEIADLFAAIMVKAMDADVIIFGTDAGYVHGLNPDDSVLTIKAQLSQLAPPGGHGTNFPAIYQKLDKKYDRVITLSDMQSWVGYQTPQVAAAAYERNYKAKPAMYNFDLAGHGTLQFPRERVFELVGFSEKVFDIMQLLETDKQALVNTIEAVVI